MPAICSCAGGAPDRTVGRLQSGGRLTRKPSDARRYRHEPEDLALRSCARRARCSAPGIAVRARLSARNESCKQLLRDVREVGDLQAIERRQSRAPSPRRPRGERPGGGRGGSGARPELVREDLVLRRLVRARRLPAEALPRARAPRRGMRWISPSSVSCRAGRRQGPRTRRPGTGAGMSDVTAAGTVDPPLGRAPAAEPGAGAFLRRAGGAPRCRAASSATARAPRPSAAERAARCDGSLPEEHDLDLEESASTARRTEPHVLERETLGIEEHALCRERARSARRPQPRSLTLPSSTAPPVRRERRANGARSDSNFAPGPRTRSHECAFDPWRTTWADRIRVNLPPQARARPLSQSRPPALLRRLSASGRRPLKILAQFSHRGPCPRPRFPILVR